MSSLAKQKSVLVYEVNLREAKEMVRRCIYRGQVPMLHGSPGVGKSAIIDEIANEENLMMIDHRLSTSAPEDMSGLPDFMPIIGANGEVLGRKAVFSPFADLFPIRGMALPPGKEGWLLFLDEFPSAPRSVQAAAYKLVLDKMVGQYRLHERVVIVAAGNKATDRAIVNAMGTAMQSRLVHIVIKVDPEQWMEDVALKHNYDKRVIGFLSRYPSKLMNFDPEHQDVTFACPRTWSKTNRLIDGVPDVKGDTPLIAGTIGSGFAAEFVQFCAIYTHLPSIDSILANPHDVPVPTELNVRWAAMSMLLEHIEEDKFQKLTEYLNRFPVEMRVLYFRNALMKKPEVRGYKGFASSAIEVMQYLTNK